MYKKQRPCYIVSRFTYYFIVLWTFHTEFYLLILFLRSLLGHRTLMFSSLLGWAQWAFFLSIGNVLNILRRLQSFCTLMPTVFSWTTHLNFLFRDLEFSACAYCSGIYFRCSLLLMDYLKQWVLKPVQKHFNVKRFKILCSLQWDINVIEAVDPLKMGCFRF